ncbi:UNVERIFIED_CONTAM: hypothetical protein HDU68_007934 [Siphonaria sp. JEL0065]|nr:hypothetical protein HDU68_007934 [Siphonaria sp. JEL0065]
MAKESKKSKKEAPKVELSSEEIIGDSDVEDSPQTKITSAFKPPKGFQEIATHTSAKPFAKSVVDTKDKNIEIIVMRVPIDVGFVCSKVNPQKVDDSSKQFPLASLNGIEIPLDKASKSSSASAPLATVKVATSSTASKSKRVKKAEDASSAPAEKKVEYGVFSLAGSTGILGAGGVGGEIGEMDEFLPLLPDVNNGGYKIASKKFAHHLSIVPLNSKIPSAADFIASANALKNVAYKARVHPEGMKPQYEPYGASTEGESLKASLERYAHKDVQSEKGTVKKESSSSKKRKMEDADSSAVAKKVTKKSSKKESK